MNHVQCAASGEWTHHICHLVAAQRKSLTCSLLTAFKQVRARGLVSEQYIACLEAQWQGNALCPACVHEQRLKFAKSKTWPANLTLLN